MARLTLLQIFALLLMQLSTSSGRITPGIRNEIKIMPGHKVKEDYHSPLPITYIDVERLPQSFSWKNVNGTNYLTHSLNQHVPQYCGSCWAHGTMSALADRIKIARGAEGDDINLSIQFILNCGGHIAGSCYGGSGSGAYEFVKKTGYVPFDTCMTYIACSSESNEGFCQSVDTSCKPLNICRTCSTFTAYGGECVELDYFPNATVAEYGSYWFDVNATMAEIFARGPVSAEVNASPLHDYKGGIYSNHTESKLTNHIVSIVGWGYSEGTQKRHWIVRNSWGHYWGEMGYFRIEMGKNILGIESGIDWATPGEFTVENYPCDEDGRNCGSRSQKYVDPSDDFVSIERRLSTGM